MRYAGVGVTVARYLLVAFLLAGLVRLPAQSVIGARAGVVQFAQGEVFAGGDLVKTAPGKFLLLTDGETLQTRKGRAEVLLGAAVFLRLGEDSALRMTNTRLDQTEVSIESGSALVEVVKVARGEHLLVRVPGLAAEMRTMGVYRFEGAGEIRVSGGQTQVASGTAVVSLGRGKRVRSSEGLKVSEFDHKKTDALQLWSARRSFRAYMSAIAARQEWINWEPSLSGWVYNRDFGVKFFSRAIQRALTAKARQQDAEGEFGRQ